MPRPTKSTKQFTVRTHPNTIDKVREFANKETEIEIAKEAKLRLKKFKVIVWFRYVSNGEQEKDFDTFETIAYTSELAKANIEQEHFRSHSVIPFKWEIQENKSMNK